MATYVLNIFNSIFCSPDIRKLQLTSTPQIIQDISHSKYPCMSEKSIDFCIRGYINYTLVL